MVTKKPEALFAIALAALFAIAMFTAVSAAEDKAVSQKETGRDVIFILMEKKQATVGDLLDTLLIYKGIPLENLSYEEKTAKLKSMGIIPGRTVITPETHLHKGFAALLYYRALGVKGGLWLRMSGTGSRNCLREMIFEGIMPESSEWDLMTGPELMALMSKAKAYEKKRAGIVEKEESLEVTNGEPKKEEAKSAEKAKEVPKAAEKPGNAKTKTDSESPKTENRSSNLFNKNSEGR